MIGRDDEAGPHRVATGEADDARRVRRAAASVGVLVGLASAETIAIGVAIVVSVLLATGRPEGHLGEGGGQPRPELDGDRVVVDVDHVIPLVVVLGVAGVAVLAVVAWLAARRAVHPLATALAAQRAFVADASHELRTPLTALTSRIQIVDRRRARGEPIGDELVALRRDARVMDDVITDLLVATEEAAAEAQDARLGDAASEALALLEPLAAEHDVALHRAIDESARAAIAPATLVRILVALVDNAIQHAPRGSRVDVEARVVDRVVELRVRDAGPGIPPEHRDRVFDRFARGAETGRRRGFGLGLALVRRAVERARGTVAIESTSPAGTTFLVRLPRA